MKKTIKYIICLLTAVFLFGCSYDDSSLADRIDSVKAQIEKLQSQIDGMNSQLTSLSKLTSGNVITAVSQDSEGKYVITYLTSTGESKTVVVATMDQMINVPLLGVKLDKTSNLYYWTVTSTDGAESFLPDKDGAKVPVSGKTPVLSANSEGYWTVDGVVLKDASGAPIKAANGESSVFSKVVVNGSGNLEITLGNGSLLTLPVQQALNLTVSAASNTAVADLATPVEFTYEAVGTNASDAIVAIAEASNIKAEMNKTTHTVKVSFESGFKSGYVILVAYDLAEHTVIRPLFFSKASDSTIEIGSASDLVQFAKDVNSSSGAQNMDVILTSDIDLSSVAEWVPIGNGVFHSVTSGSEHNSTYEGASFKGHFDGQGHSIRNLKMVAKLSGEGTVYGLFGILDGAAVSNLVLGAESNDKSSFTVSADDRIDAGVIAGVSYGARVENCVNWIPIECKGSTVSKRFAVGMVGFLYGGADSETMSVLDNLTNNGKITADAGDCTAAGYESVMVGGITGFSDALAATTSTNTISNCVNNGDMTSRVGRCSGICATMNSFTTLDNCVNNGNQLNTFTNGRIGNITCVVGNGGVIKDCVNNGNLTTTDAKTTTGGLVGLLSHNTVTFTGGGNYGTILGTNEKYLGLLGANLNAFTKIDNIVAAGAVGVYKEGGDPVMYELTQDNYMGHIGYYSSSSAEKITNIIFMGGSDKKGIRTADDMVAFAKAVNAGESLSEWQDEDGGVNMLTDIDMSLVAEWTPIGNALSPIVDGVPAVTGNAFSGHFNGLGHKIKNLKLVSAGTSAGENYGLFGTLVSGAVVENFILDSSCSLTVTATAYISSGVVAGMVIDATVRDVTSYANITFKGNAGAKTQMGAAMIGYVFSDAIGVTIDSAHNYGVIEAENPSTNVEGGASAFHIAGIVAFANAKSDATVYNIISNCNNYGNMTSATGRTSGIVAAANRNTQIINCVNHGNQLNICPKTDGARLGMITCNMGTGTSMTGCVNYGDLTSTTGGRCGGITSLSGTATFENCANYGVILTDSANRGVFWGYNNGTASWTTCTAAGKVGSYNAGVSIFDSYTEAEKEKYLGAQGAKKSTLTDITYLIGTTSPSTGGEAKLRILFIGNSFTKDAVEHLPGILAAAGLDKIQLTHMYYGGRTVPEYDSGWSTASDYHCYECGPGQTSWTDVTGKTIEGVAKSGHWDVVTIQEHTGRQEAWNWTSTEKDAISGLINKIKGTQTGTMPQFYYIMSQAYFDMNKIGTSQRPTPFTTQLEMYNVIVTQAKKVMAETAFDGIIATGTTLQNLRTSSLNNSMNLTRDGYHMDYGISRYAAACTVFETIISPKFGDIHLTGNTYRYNISNTTSGSYSTPVTDTNAPIALAAANAAIAKPYEITDMSSSSSVPDNGIGDIDYDKGEKE